MSAVTPRPCRRCQAALTYQPGASTQLVCRYCGAVEAIDLAAPTAGGSRSYQELVAASFATGHHPSVQTLGCKACGAVTTKPANVLADRCPFCDGPVVSAGSTHLRAPDGVLPFRLDETAARAAVVRWEQALWWKPAVLIGKTPPPMHPIYLPYWTFDWNVSTDFVGSFGEKRRNEVRGRVDKAMTVTVLASSSVPTGLGADLEPWDLEAVVAPRDELVLGIRAETHGEAQGIARSAELAHRILESEVDDAIYTHLGHQGPKIEQRTYTYHAITFRLVLLPVWTTSYRFGAKNYRVLVNGRSNEVVGERPVSSAKVALSVAALLALPFLAGIGAAIRGAAGERAGAFILGAWSVFAAQALLSLILGFSGAKAPSRHGQFALYRKAGRDQIGYAEVERGVLQSDPSSKKELARMFGVFGLFMSLAPIVGPLLVHEPGATLGVLVVTNAFAGACLLGIAWSWRESRKKRRFLLHLDAPRPTP